MVYPSIKSKNPSGFEASLVSMRSRFAEILDIEAEILFLYLICPQRIDVLHHQVPHGGLGVDGGRLKHLEIERLVGGGDVGRELAHLIDLAVVCVLVCHGQHLVGAERALQRDVAVCGERCQGLCHGVNVARARIVCLDD